MGAKRKSAVSRREVLDGSSLTKQFYDPEGFRSGLPPGWSPALVLTLGAAAASYGGSVRTKLFDDMQELASGVTKNQGKEAYRPTVLLTPGRKSGEVSVEITAPASAAADYVWASDAETGEIFAGRKFGQETPKLAILVSRGRRFVPTAHCTVDGSVWEGEAIVAAVLASFHRGPVSTSTRQLRPGAAHYVLWRNLGAHALRVESDAPGAPSKRLRAPRNPHTDGGRIERIDRERTASGRSERTATASTPSAQRAHRARAAGASDAHTASHT